MPRRPIMDSIYNSLRELFDQREFWVVLVAVTWFLLGILIAASFIKWRRRRLGLLNRKKGRRAEKKARKLLEKMGFEILEYDPVFLNEMAVNGSVQNFEVTPDLLVVRDGREYVVEVKRYNDNGGISNAGIRRQVLEYLHATGMPCLLVRMPEGTLDLIELPPNHESDTYL